VGKAIRLALPLIMMLSPLAGPSAEGPRLLFDSERIRLEIHGDTLRVEGLYRFIDTTGRDRLSLFYPYPADSLLGTAWMDSLAIRPRAGDPWTPARFVESDRGDGAHWHLEPPGGERFEVLAIYRQLLHGRHARYIVTSTRAWRRPLRHARFELALPPGASLSAGSFPFEPDDEGILVFEAEEFLPDEDIIVKWSGDPSP